jgi:protein-disulfide isomerase
MDKYPDSPLVITVGKALLGNSKITATPEEARKWIAAVSGIAAKHGPRLANETTLQLAETVAPMASLKELALEMGKKAESTLTDKATTEEKVRVMKALLPALKNNAKMDEAKTVEIQLAKLETALDKEYMVKVPPFKPEMYAGRKEKSDRKVVFELFTGAQCPPCVAADVAFDGLEKSYKPSELILLQYHLHIPGPDPLVNADTEARAKYYNVNSTPSTVFNGKTPLRPGGGGMAASKTMYNQYCKVINPILEENTDAKLMVTATRLGNKIDIKAEVNGLKDPGEKKRLRLVLVEETIRYVGGNKLRFHHHVVRDMPGGVEGFALKEPNSQHSASVNLDELRQKQIKYLDSYAETRPFPYPDRPLDYKHLKVIGLVQDDTTKEISEVVQVDIGGEVTTRLSSEK